MTDYKLTSEASGFNPFRSNGYEGQTLGSAECGNLAAFTANSTFVVAQTTYYSVPVLPGPITPAVTIHGPERR